MRQERRNYSVVTYLLGGLAKPVYLLRMSGTRVHDDVFIGWVKTLQAEAAIVVDRCAEYLDQHHSDA